jgi:hypothetical protein
MPQRLYVPHLRSASRIEQQVTICQLPDARRLMPDASPLILQLMEPIVKSFAIHQLQVGARFNDAAPV